MKVVIYLLAILTFASCSKSDLSPIEMLAGKWKDQAEYKGTQTINGVTDSVSYSNIYYTILTNGTYEIKDELPYGVPSNGTWVYDESKNQVSIIPNTPDVELGINRTYKWDIISLSETELEVTFKYWGAPLTTGQEPIQLQLYRKFIRQ